MAPDGSNLIVHLAVQSKWVFLRSCPGHEGWNKIYMPTVVVRLCRKGKVWSIVSHPMRPPTRTDAIALPYGWGWWLAKLYTHLCGDQLLISLLEVFAHVCRLPGHQCDWGSASGNWLSRHG
jgi:hypothetical protein